ncbi:hypothetical protein ACLB1E_09100 [Escherichia coli]
MVAAHCQRNVTIQEHAYSQGEKAETLYYIVKGSVAVLIKDEEGKGI